MRLAGAFVLLILIQTIAGCGPTTPSRVPTTTTASTAAPTQAPRPGPQPTTGYLAFVLDTAGRPVGGATVEVVDGPEAGRLMVSDDEGHFFLPRTFDETITFRASKAGYVAATAKLHVDQVLENFRWLGFYLELREPPVNLAGDFTVTIDADNACVDLPQVARSRTYQATIALLAGPDIPVGTRFQLTIVDGNFEGNRGFTVGVAGADIQFWIDDHHGTPILYERLAERTYLAYGGSASTRVDNPISTFSVALNGYVDYCELKSSGSTYYSCLAGLEAAHSHCTSMNHRITLTRR